MKVSDRSLIDDFDNAVGAAFAAISAFEKSPSEYISTENGFAMNLLDDRLMNVRDITRVLNFTDPEQGQLAFQEYASLIYLVSDCLGGIDQRFEDLAERHLKAHYVLGSLPVGIYKNSYGLGM